MAYDQWFFTGVKLCGGKYKAYWDGTFLGEYASKREAMKAIKIKG